MFVVDPLLGNNGGVHINAGIMNLAFYLLVRGGSHPREGNGENKVQTGVVVEGIGFEAAAEIVSMIRLSLFLQYPIQPCLCSQLCSQHYSSTMPM